MTIPELSDPFAWQQVPGRAFRSVKRRVERGIGSLSEKRQPSADEQVQPPWSPPFFDYQAGAIGPLHKKALMTYIAGCFHQSPKELRHSNYIQSVEIARAFNRLGYSVDIIDLWDTKSVPRGEYDVFFGEWNNFGRLMPLLQKETLKIFYGTRSYWAVEHEAIEKRALRVKNTRGANLPVVHWEEENNFVQMADAVIAIGNKITSGTFSPHHAIVSAIDNTALPLPTPNLKAKDFASAKSHFLWLGSGTLLRKGLDLVLEAFLGLPDMHLWVCGPLDDYAERNFIRAYRQELFYTPNIHSVGMVKPDSDILQKLVAQCAATVFVSCSEGMSGGVLDCMSYGLIPIVSLETGIDTEEFGITLKDSTVDSLRSALRKFMEITPNQCQAMAQKAYRQTQTRYTMATFSQNIERHLSTSINRCTKCNL